VIIERTVNRLANDYRGVAQARQVDLRENLAEKLARARRSLLAKDIYDLGHLGPRLRGEMPVIRELVYLKVFGDVVVSGKGGRPFFGGREYRNHAPAELLDTAEVGALVQRAIDWPALLRVVADVFGDGIGDPRDDRERRLAACETRDRYWYGVQLEEVKRRHGRR